MPSNDPFLTYRRVKIKIKSDYSLKCLKNSKLNINLISDILAKELKLSNVQVLNEPSSRKESQGR
jgi:hypothetical protein